MIDCIKVTVVLIHLLVLADPEKRTPFPYHLRNLKHVSASLSPCLSALGQSKLTSYLSLTPYHTRVDDLSIQCWHLISNRTVHCTYYKNKNVTTSQRWYRSTKLRSTATTLLLLLDCYQLCSYLCSTSIDGTGKLVAYLQSSTCMRITIALVVPVCILLQHYYSTRTVVVQ